MRKHLSFLTVLMLSATLAFSQQRTITGRVVDETGQPVSGASVTLKGASTGASASAEGNFKINAKTGDVLVVSALNYGNTEVRVGGQNSLTVSLNASSTKLSEVIVTTALGVQKQARSLGYSTAKVSGADVSQAKPVSVVNGLTGKVSGLQINTVNNGLFAPTRVTLRGNRSLTGNNQPLIVVDGAIYYSDISTLNPEDVSDMTILKGSSASAVYGSDASNGVIIVTTKHGTRNKSSNLTFSSTVQAEKVAYLPAYQSRFGSNGGEAYEEDFNDLSTYQPYENQSYGPEYNGKLVPLGRPAPDNTVFYVPYSAVKNQKKDFFNTGITTQNNLSFQTSDETGSFFMSLQDLVSKATMPGDRGRRDIFRVGGTKRYGIFSANYSASYTYKNTNTTNTGTVYNVLIETPTLAPLSKLKNWRTDYFASPDGYFNDYYKNPYAIIDQERYTSDENNIAANIQLNLKPFKWLNLSYRTAIDNISSRYEYKGAPIVYSDYALNDPRIVFSNADATGVDTVTSLGAKAQAVNDNPHPASYATANFNNLLFSTDFLASFNTIVKNDFSVSGTLGYSYLDNKINYTPVGINGGANLTFPVYNTSVYSGAPSVLGQAVAQARKMGIFGEATLGYKQLAFLHGSYRTDIDSRLSKDNRFIPYYDIDASLVLSDMFKQMTDNGVLSYAKLRVAHSLTGNVSPLANGSQYIAYGAYVTEPSVGPASGFPYAASGLSGYSISTTIANPNIKPEKVTENELGLELAFLRDRITLNGSIYKAVTTDGIVNAQISRASGAVQALVNAAKTQNKGLELDLKGTVLKTRNVTWNVGINWTHTESKVLAISGSVPQLTLGTSNPYVQSASGNTGTNANSYAVVGQPYPVIQSYDWVRDSATGKVIVDYKTGLPTKSTQLTNLGQANPKDILGFTTNVTYKNFTFSATADYRGGHKIFNVLGQTIDHSGVGLTTASTGRQRFIFPNSVYKDAKGNYVDNTNIAVDDANWNFWPVLYNSIGANYVVSAAAWKLREVVISYNFPRTWIGYGNIIKNASLALSGRNLIMIRPSTNKWTDPEFNEGTGNDVGRTGLGQAPPTRIFSATLSVTF